MKKILVMSICSLVSWFSLTGCENKSDVITQKEPALSEESSAISQREVELGVKLFRKDVLLQDKSGQNKVLMTFAALDETTIDNYLTNKKFSIEPITDLDAYISQPAKELSIKSAAKDESLSGKDYAVGLVINEEKSRMLANGIKNYVVEVSNSQTASKNARPAYAYHSEHVSDTWCERAHFDGGHVLDVRLDAKDRWYYGYNTRWASYGYIVAARINIDGTYKAKWVVDYDIPGGYTYSFIQL